MKTVCVVWTDAVADHDERKPGEFSDLPEVRTYGVLMEATEDYIRVASEDVGGGTYRCTSTIPRSLVVDIKELA